MSGPRGCAYAGRGREPLTERHVQALWYDRDLRPPALVTRTGEALRVVDPGRWNLGPGPDFLDAVVEVGPTCRRMRGDVEVHLSPADWTAHGHGGDPAYRNVAVHVTWGCGPDPESLPSAAVSVWLGRFLTADPGFSPEQIDLGAYPFARLPSADRPCFAAMKGSPDLAAAVLSAAGACRLRAKARRLAARLYAPSASAPEVRRRQVFYEEVMNALGYRRNSPGFRHVARAVPLEALLSEPENAAAAFLAAAEFTSWRRTGSRPRNSPQARLSAAAAIFTATGVMGLADASDFSPRGCRRMLGVLTEGRLMGRGRAAAVIANVIAPLALAEERIGSVPAWLPPEDLSEPVRLTAYRMFGRDHNPAAFYAGNGLHIQGLIQIHRDYCLQVHPDCAACRLISTLHRP